MDLKAFAGVAAIIITIASTGAGTYLYCRNNEAKEELKDLATAREALLNFIDKTGSQKAKDILEESYKQKLNSTSKIINEAMRLKRLKREIEDDDLKQAMFKLSETRERVNNLIYLDVSDKAKSELRNSYRFTIQTSGKAKKETERLNKIAVSLEFTIKKNLLDELQTKRNKLFMSENELAQDGLNKSLSLDLDDLRSVKKEIERLNKLVKDIESLEKDNLLKELEKTRGDLFRLIIDDETAKEELEDSYKINMDSNSINEEIVRLREVIAERKICIRRKNFDDLMERRAELEKYRDERLVEDVLTTSFNRNVDDVLLPREIERLDKEIENRETRYRYVR